MHAAGVNEDAVLAERKAWADAQILAQVRYDTQAIRNRIEGGCRHTEIPPCLPPSHHSRRAGNARLTARAGGVQLAGESYRAADCAAPKSPGAANLARAAREAGNYSRRVDRNMQDREKRV